ncbi:ATP-binding protein [Streptomyces hoynatensis]|uniref:ATP-binding protein n=1 Tax=Streptomyces hoynatensis TaxID=1141874 RepID=UPI00131A483F|nr:ATP-binding protein [Streptomyces hoynatensis]
MATSSRAQSLERYASAACPSGRFTFRLPAADTSAAEARRRIRHQLTQWRTPAETCDNAQLVVSELVTNALRHTRSETVGCELELFGSLLRVAVASDGTGPAHREPTQAGPEEESGRGLLLVCALATVWGVRPREAGRGHVVWADLPLGEAA